MNPADAFAPVAFAAIASLLVGYLTVCAVLGWVARRRDLRHPENTALQVMGSWHSSGGGAAVSGEVHPGPTAGIATDRSGHAPAARSAVRAADPAHKERTA